MGSGTGSMPKSHYIAEALLTLNREPDITQYGYTVNPDGTLRPTREEDAAVVYPDVVVKPNVLCTQCTKLHQKLLLAQERSGSHLSIPAEWHQSLIRGCHMCFLLLRLAVDNRKELESAKQASESKRWTLLDVLEWGKTVNFNYTGSYSPSKEGKGTGRTRATLRLPYSKWPYLDWNADLASTDPLSNFTELEIRVKLSVTNASNATFALARSWFKTCIESHDLCSNGQSRASVLPTRLLDVDRGHSPSIRLIEPKDNVK
jgi:hypothetical protein